MFVALFTRNFKEVTFFLTLLSLVTFMLLIGSPYHNVSVKLKIRNRESLKPFEVTIEKAYPFATNYERKDWHDWTFIEYEKSREGPGEQGEAYNLTDPRDIEKNEKLFETEGLFVVVSDKISVNRSVPDTRLSRCKHIHYLKALPKTSVIVIFNNEHFSVLLRTIHSIYNRTPHELLHEILMINDASVKPELYEPLQKYVRENFDGRVKIVNLVKRRGLIVTRMEGARRASGEVLVFLDSHMEVNVNWLPPLLEPIAIDPKTATTPVIDNFWRDTFKWQTSGDGSRGVFDWSFDYKWLPRRREDMIHPEKPAPLPIMLGCAFAIRKDYFFDLGAYDEKLIIWNGENYELSFKLWLCGGKLLEVPCSRIAHVFRGHNEWRKHPGIDFVAHNFKRIAEVWLDDYKQYLYKTDPSRYANVDAGDLTKEKLIRKNLNCKPFQYFLEFVMPDMLERYPYDDPGSFARGSIRSEAVPKKCVDTLSQIDGASLGLYDCHADLVYPGYSQNFVLSWDRSIMPVIDAAGRCFDVDNISLRDCAHKFANQYWFYNVTSHQLSNSPDDCLTAVLQTNSLSLQPCDESNRYQKWLWGYTNHTALLNWKTAGVIHTDRKSINKRKTYKT